MGKNEQDIQELQKKHREQLVAARQREKDRKARVHRLIGRGAYIESLIAGADKMTDEDFKSKVNELMTIGLWDI